MAAAVAAAAAAQPSPSSREIQQSPLDRRLYRRMILPNGLAVLLISDPEMAAALHRSERDAKEGGKDGDGLVRLRLCQIRFQTCQRKSRCWWARYGNSVCSGWWQGRAAEAGPCCTRSAVRNVRSVTLNDTA